MKVTHRRCARRDLYNESRSEGLFGGILEGCLYIEVYEAVDMTNAELQFQRARPDNWWRTAEVGTFIIAGHLENEANVPLKEVTRDCECCADHRRYR